MAEPGRRNLKPLKSRASIKSRWHMADSTCLAVGLNQFMTRTAHEFSAGEELECAIDLQEAGTVHCVGKVAEVTKQKVTGEYDIPDFDYEIMITQIDQENEARLRTWLGDAAPPVSRAAPPAGRAARPAPAAPKPPTAGAPGGKAKRMDPRELQRVLEQLKKKRPKS